LWSLSDPDPDFDTAHARHELREADPPVFLPIEDADMHRAWRLSEVNTARRRISGQAVPRAFGGGKTSKGDLDAKFPVVLREEEDL